MMKWWVEHFDDAERNWLTFVGKCFAESRADLRMSARELAARTGISASHILRIESGEFDFTITKCLRLAECLALPVGLIMEPVLFRTRRIESVGRNFLEENVSRDLTGGSAAREEELIELLIQIISVVVQIHLSTNPQLVAKKIRHPFKECETRLRTFARAFDVEMNHVDRLFAIQSFMVTPYASLAKCGLIDPKLVEKHFNWLSSVSHGRQTLLNESNFIKPYREETISDLLKGVSRARKNKNQKGKS